jgi:ubiquitin conjugation factor E4 B
VSYAASALLVPDLFEMGVNGHEQLVHCLMESATANPITDSITFGLRGPTSSFYHALMNELHSNIDDDDEVVTTLIQTQMLGVFHTKLGQCQTLRDVLVPASTSDVSGSPAVLVSGLSAMCSHKKVAAAVCGAAMFVLPPKASKEATVKITPPPPANMPTMPPMGAGGAAGGGDAAQRRFFRMMQQSIMAGGAHSKPYLARSGPALEKNTLLGLVLRLGLPPDHATVNEPFRNATHKTMNEIRKGTEDMRQSLRQYHTACHALVKSLIVGGDRQKVLQWIGDALEVNVGASALRPDKTKCSSPSLLMNLNVILLKLCEPFVNKPEKASLIDPRFVNCPSAHRGVFETTGDDAIPRLRGEMNSSDAPATASSPPPGTAVNANVNNMTISPEDYQPKNGFVPQVYFYTARSLTLGLVPASSSHLSLLRQISHMAWTIRNRNGDLRSDPQFSQIVSHQYASEVTLLNPEFLTETMRFYELSAGFLASLEDDALSNMPEHFVDDICDLLSFVARMAPKDMAGLGYSNMFTLVVKLLSPEHSKLVRNYNLRAKLGDVLYNVYLPPDRNDKERDSDVPPSVCCDPKAGGQPYLLSSAYAQETLAPALLLLYGEVEHTGYYDKMKHRAHICTLLKYLWDSPNKEHRSAFRRITSDKKNFIKFANGIMNETNALIASVMEKLPEIRRVQVQMVHPAEWAAVPEEQRETILSRHEENEQEVKRALPLCNKTLQMLGYLNTDDAIRQLFLADEMCARLVNMLLHVLTKLVGSRGLELKVDNPESYNFRPKEMLRDLCSIFAEFASSPNFQVECAKSGYYNSELLSKSIKTCRKLALLKPELLIALEALPDTVLEASHEIRMDEALTANAPEDFLDPIMATFMRDPVRLPTSYNIVDRSTITQHLLNDPHDPFNRKPLTQDQIEPATELKARMEAWLAEQRANAAALLE